MTNPSRLKPEYAGKMNLYLSSVDVTLRHPDDAPTKPLTFKICAVRLRCGSGMSVQRFQQLSVSR